MALRLFWDASALAKRYAVEIGSDTADALWADASAAHHTTTFQGYAETFSILLRKHNRSDIDAATFATAKALLRREVINSLDFSLIPVEVGDVLSGIALMERHSINSTDAGILAAFLRYAQASGDSCLLLAADKRLLRAASAEGLAVLNPESLPAAAVSPFLLCL